MSSKDIVLQDKGKETLLYKVPFVNFSFEKGMNLSVEKNYVAFLCVNNKPADIFEEGEYVLNKKNTPVFSELIKKYKNEDYLVNIYYVSLKEFKNIPWGTISPILMRDDELGILNIHAFGYFSFKVEDIKNFIKEIFGKLNTYGSEKMDAYLKSLAFFGFTNLMIDNIISIRNILSDKTEAQEFIKKTIKDDFEDLGLELTNYKIESISLPEGLEKKIDKKVKNIKSVKEKIKKCKSCGEIIEKGVKYCPNCGEDCQDISKQCPDCKLVVTFDANYCPECGHKLFSKKDVVFCKRCGRIVKDEDKFCPDCGELL